MFGLMICAFTSQTSEFTPLLPGVVFASRGIFTISSVRMLGPTFVVVVFCSKHCVVRV